MKKFVIIGLLVALVVGFLLSPYASSLPDGLEKVAIKYGFISKEHSLINAPFPDYTVKFVKNEKLATGFAGLIGTVIVFLLVTGIFKLLARKNR